MCKVFLTIARAAINCDVVGSLVQPKQQRSGSSRVCEVHAIGKCPNATAAVLTATTFISG